MARKATAHKEAMRNRSRNKDGSLRKRRTDCNHVVYWITCVPTGDTYLGLTFARGRAYQTSALKRWDGHVTHALTEGRPYPLHEAIRTHGPEAFTVEVLCVVRGKEATHAKERELIASLKPTLNVECTERKMRAARKVRAS